MTEEISIRRAQIPDLQYVAALAGELVRMHHAADPGRFLLVDQVEEGYAHWLAREISRVQAVVLIACREQRVVGYAYATIEGRNWNLLLDAHAAVHDVFVAIDARRGGVGRTLVGALIAELEGLGAKRFVLSTLVSNEPAQRLFRSFGFRPTMLEMTKAGAF